MRRPRRGCGKRSRPWIGGFPKFPAAISFLAFLTPEDAREHLQKRHALLESEVVRLAGLLTTYAEALPRLLILEYEYLRAVAAVELEWVGSVIEDLRAGRLAWSEESLRQVSSSLAGEDPDSTFQKDPVDDHP